MAYLKALLGFTKYSPGRLRDFAMWIYVSMNGNPHFPNPPVSIETLLTKIEAFSPAIAATLDGSRTAFAERNKQFKELRETLVQRSLLPATSRCVLPNAPSIKRLSNVGMSSEHCPIHLSKHQLTNLHNACSW
jgi:hypothetical protein